MSTRTTLLVLPILLALAAGGAAQTAVLLKDINAQPTGRQVNLGSEFRPLGIAPTRPPTLYFSAWTEAHGRELWKTQGTAQTTAMVADWNPGPASSNPGPIVAMQNGAIVLEMTHPKFGRELHQVIPGADDGIRLIEDREVGPEGRERHFEQRNGPPPPKSPLMYGYSRPDPQELYGIAQLSVSANPKITTLREFSGASPHEPELLRIGGTTYCSIDDGKHGPELYVSDGTAAGTRLVKDNVPGKDGSGPRGLTEYNNQCYMSIEFPGKGRELGRSDGKDITLVADINPNGDSSPEEPVVMGGKLYYRAFVDRFGSELWCTDANDNTVRVSDTNPGKGDGDPRGMTVFDGALWFNAVVQGGNRQLHVLRPNQAPVAVDATTHPNSDPRDLTVYQSYLVYSARKGLRPDRQLYTAEIKNGKAVITQRTSFNTGKGGANPRHIVWVGDYLLYAGEDDTILDELFLFDVRTGTVRRLADLNGPFTQTRSSAAGVTGVQYLRGQWYFGADDGKEGFDLFATDGTAAGTRRVANLDRGLTTSQIAGLTPVNSTLVTSATDFLARGNELYNYDPDTQKLELIKDIAPGRFSSNPRRIAGPFKVKGSTKEIAFFQANDGQTGFEPWRTDGTDAGTFLLADIAKGSVSSGPKHWTDLGNGLVLFVAENLEHGRELWRTDGTKAGTRLVKDIRPGREHGVYLSEPAAVIKGAAFFPGAGRINGKDFFGLWGTNGTSSSTVPIAIVRNSITGLPSSVTAFDGRLFFAVHDGKTGRELWVAEPFKNNVFKQVADLRPGSGSSDPRELTVAGEKLFFVADPFAGATSLFVTDGKKATDLRVVGARGLEPAGDKVYFRAFAPRSVDVEPWVSDGTPEGTRLLVDIRRGPQGSQVRDISVTGGKVFVSADDGVHGVESYVVQEPGAVAEPVGTPCGSAYPRLAATPPTLGQDMQLTITNTPKDHLGAIFSSVAPRGRGLDLGNGCRTQVDLSEFVVTHRFQTGAGGTVRRSIPIPNDGRLREGDVVVWAVFVPLVGPPMVQATNAVLLGPGR